MIKIDKHLLDEISNKAKKSPRKRMNYNFHKEDSDTLQRMLNAIEPGSYIRPHKHENPDKREAFFALRGIIAIIEYDNEGNITEYKILDSKKESYGVEVAPRTWHSMISLQSSSVTYEVKDGPYNPSDDKIFASWAPEEGSKNEKVFIDKILSFIHKEE